MNDYKHYRVEDFLMDETFVAWILDPNDARDAYWEEVLMQFPAQQAAMKEAKSLLLQLRVKPMPTRFSKEEKAHMIQTACRQYDQVQVKGLKKRLLLRMVAAAIVLLCGIGSWIFLHHASAPVHSSNIAMMYTEGVKTVENKSVNPVFVMLPDQSSIILYPHSHIVFEERSFATKREVALFGKAFFDITKDKAHPFQVNTSALVTKVLGTSFMVDARGDRAEQKVVVSSGLVEVSRKIENKSETGTSPEKEKPVQLKPKQELALTARAIRVSQVLDNVADRVDPYGFDFEAMPLKEIAEKFSKIYRVQITIDDKELPNRSVTASLSGLSLYEKLNLISKAIGASYVVEDGVIVFRADSK